MVIVVKLETGAAEKSCQGYADQQNAEDAVYKKKEFIGSGSQKIAGLFAEFKADSLQDKGEEYRNPDSLGSAKAGGIKKRKGCKKSTTEKH